MIEKLIDKTKGSDLLYLSGVIINIMNSESKLGGTYPILPELFSTLGIDTTINMIKYFGGETITLPTHAEMYEAFLVIVCYYKKKVEGKDWDVIKKEVDIKINPHILGKLIENIDKKISLEIDDLKDMGLDKYVNQISGQTGVA